MSTSDEDATQTGVGSESSSRSTLDADRTEVAPGEAALPGVGPAEAAPTEAAPTGASTDTNAPPRATAAGRVWIGLTVGVVLVVLLIIFIAENSGSVTVSFLGAHGKISLGLAMLAAAVVGAVVTLLVGTTRILQLRREVRRHVHHV
jgi:uncharacterized integral membrane protein